MPEDAPAPEKAKKKAKRLPRPLSPTSPGMLKARERQDMALQLRTNGAKLQDIARQLKYSGHTSVMNAIQASLDRIPDPDVRMFRKIYSERYEEAIFASYEAAMNVNHARHDKAAKLWLAAMDKLTRLHGVEVQPDPKKQIVALEITGEGGKPLDAIITELTTEERARIWNENASMLKRMSGGMGPPPEGEIDRRADFKTAEDELAQKPKGWADGAEDTRDEGDG